MKITKQDALVLAKILHMHVGNKFLVVAAGAEKSVFQETLESLVERLDDFMVFGDDREDEDDEEDEDLDSAEKDGEEEDDEEDDAGARKAEEPSSEDDEEPAELDCDDAVTGEELHALKSANADDGKLEFEKASARVYVLIDGYSEFEATHIKRPEGFQGKQLHIRDDDGCWHVFVASSRWPTEWLATFPIGELLEVVA